MARRAQDDAIKRVTAQLRMLGVTTYQLSKPEIPELARVMFPEEIVKAFIFGYYEGGYGLLAATNRRVLFIDKRFFNLKVEDIPYSTINSVEYSLGLFYGIARLYTRAQPFHFWWVKKPNLLHFCDYVDDRMLKLQEK